VVIFTEALSTRTGGWFPLNRQVISQGTVQLAAGAHTMRVSRGSAFPHVKGFRLVPVGVSNSLVSGWCGQVLNFNEGILPSNWTLTKLGVGPGLSGNRLLGESIQPGFPNGGAIVQSTPMTSINPTSKIVVGYTANYGLSATNYTGFEIATNNGSSISIFIIAVNPGQVGGYGNIRIVQNGLFSVFSGTILFDPHYMMTFGVQNIHIEITNSTALVKVTSTTDGTTMTGTFSIPALLPSATISRHFTYTNGAQSGVLAEAWTDDLSIQCLR
jgi:hypothetical protein